MAQKKTERAGLITRVLEIGKEFDALGNTPDDDRAAVRLADEVIRVTDRLEAKQSERFEGRHGVRQI